MSAEAEPAGTIRESNKKAPEPSVSFGSVESSDALFPFCVYNTLKHIVSSFPVETTV